MTPLQESLSKCKVEGNILSLPSISDGMLPNYAEVKKALINAGAKYKSNTFVFPNDAQPYIDRLMGGEKVNIKKEFQFYPTPDSVCDKLVSLAGIKEDDLVLEPSAGQGAIIKAIKRVFPKKDVQWCELMDINQNVLFKLQDKQTFICPDFLDTNLKNYFNKVIANPPFQNNQDILHIQKMYDVLKKGGRLVSISSSHWRLSNNKKETEFRKWLEKVGAEIKSLPAGAFKESGTNIETLIIVINKK